MGEQLLWRCWGWRIHPETTRILMNIFVSLPSTSTHAFKTEEVCFPQVFFIETDAFFSNFGAVPPTMPVLANMLHIVWGIPQVSNLRVVGYYHPVFMLSMYVSLRASIRARWQGRSSSYTLSCIQLNTLRRYDCDSLPCNPILEWETLNWTFVVKSSLKYAAQDLEMLKSFQNTWNSCGDGSSWLTLSHT